MSVTEPLSFTCPYCMASNTLMVDPIADPGQQQIIDCQVCCQPIEVSISGKPGAYDISAHRDDE
ncbi:CPXCG motif-containing cysteine-rich protein [Aestuariibacter halophilus]|uniref:CPXCG motif-containing cysteine-rich protein n=1 Tax=Fluctibacter halophilus TaxID=226011 RepID=A0ABS8G7R2_9ALTE|nr:CPXCG motif-containing cysteine-rich protein [Aestuariibacter halophilus]MCC2616568.1 CPXCG motif-containing cysteine-rich protein [Aestuariibacter halophilus]